MVDFVYKRQDSYQWFTVLEDRKQKEIEWNKVYDTPSFRHGTDGHNLRIIVSELAKKLNEYEDEISDLKDNPECDECEDCDDIISNEINELEQSNAHLISELEDANERIKELERAIEQLEKLKDKEDA